MTNKVEQQQRLLQEVIRIDEDIQTIKDSLCKLPGHKTPESEAMIDAVLQKQDRRMQLSLQIAALKPTLWERAKELGMAKLRQQRAEHERHRMETLARALEVQPQTQCCDEPEGTASPQRPKRHGRGRGRGGRGGRGAPPLWV